MKKQEKTKKLNKYVVFWTPINKPSTTVNFECWARNPEHAILKAKKTTRSKAKMYVNEITNL